MNVLIVDDDRFVVSALEQKIDWTSSGIQQIYSAYNIRQAKKIFDKNKVHILISDIEMPQGSGLELLAWIRSEGFNVQAIYLTNFADFNYAQKAIELQSFEYYLKPIEFDKLELIIKKTINKVKQSQVNEDAVKVGHYWQQNKEEILDHFWHTYLKNNDSISNEELQAQLKIKQIDYSLHDYFVPLLLDLFPYTLVDNSEIISLFDKENNLQNRLKSVIAETFKDASFRLDSFLEISKNKEEYLAIFKLLDCTSEVSSKDLHSSCNQIIAAINNQLNCDVQCGIGAISPLDKIPTTVKDIQVLSKETVDFRNKTFLLETNIKDVKKYVEPNLQLFEHYLETENKLSFINKCYQYLTNLLDKNALNHSVLCSFRLDITQLIYAHLKKKEILANKLFQGKTGDLLLAQSSRSIDDLMIYISYLVDVSLDYMAFTNSQKSVVNTIYDYIDQNYQENITRTSLAKIVYLSPDYIARYFKKETGISLVNYIIKKRVDIAKDLLNNTDLPVHIISDKVGYGNYSYFTKLFKKETNYTPVDYRKLSNS
ncbi:response regulator transcription factor [Metabacillus bambusae]|uniref:Response regulator n=1 Tax=Metabacillus bambusae TaxID=2795218 RepID=A0ABS3N555_9BACI|nr:response regulator [Metabacillus bambusae]MBO1513427.1 response regulator [Metabacillus bambusae]